jgi:hypothetical protein
MYKFFFLENDENDATDYYLKIIARAISKKGDIVEKANSIQSIAKGDIVITISPKAFFKVWLYNKKQHIIHWFQGITPEETFLIFENNLSRFPRYLIHSFLEQFILRRAVFIFFVSDAMREFYRKKYNYGKSNYFIMPCFNQKLDICCFNKERYLISSFVYAGSLDKWQCIDETLILFKKIKTLMPDSNLTLLTKETEQAIELINKYNLKDVHVKYVPYYNLNQELQKYKFGFLIRKDIAINNVATPTKMNSYMANGVIPVYYPVIIDFVKVLSQCNYIVKLTDDLNVFRNFDNIDVEKMLSEYKFIFDIYYNEDNYINLINNII